MNSDDFELDSKEIDDELSCVETQDKEEWKTVARKNRRFMNKVYVRRRSKSIELMNPRNMLTECLPSDPTKKIQLDGGGLKFVKKTCSWRL